MELFVKTSVAPTDRFLREAEGLNALRANSRFRIPEVVSVDDQHIKLEKVKTSQPIEGFWADFAGKLRDMHSRPQPGFGFMHDNHIGYTEQKNPRLTIPWADYFIEHRLSALLHRLSRTYPDLPEKFAQAEPTIRAKLSVVNVAPSLLHGDLWSGNYLCDENNQPVLIDPACYWGHSETDLAMTELFGGFAEEFYEAYGLAAGYEERRDIYNLYHLFNHWLLFGGGYRAQAMKILEDLSH